LYLQLEAALPSRKLLWYMHPVTQSLMKFERRKCSILVTLAGTALEWNFRYQAILALQEVGFPSRENNITPLYNK
jgi:hypothetical protein